MNLNILISARINEVDFGMKLFQLGQDRKNI